MMEPLPYSIVIDKYIEYVQKRVDEMDEEEFNKMLDEFGDEECEEEENEPFLPIIICNSAVMTANGIYKIESLDLNSAKSLLHNNPYISAIGHPDLAYNISNCLNIQVETNRIPIKQEIGQKMIIYSLMDRKPNDKKFTKNQLRTGKHRFRLCTRLE